MKTRSDHYILNESGEPEACDMMTWAMWLEGSRDKRRVAVYESGDVKVSTVFLGLDHNYEEEGEAEIWETLVLGGDHDGEMDRCGGNRQNAMEMHARMLSKLGL